MSRSLRAVLACVMISSVTFGFQNAASAANPVVDTTIGVERTGSEPWDSTTWDTNALTNEGMDADEFNDVVRLQDSITYKVEASVNDSDVENLVSEVLLDKKQKWIEIPTGCQTDTGVYPNLNPISEIVDSVTRLPGGDDRLLICNIGPAIEGTNRVVYPAARVIGASFDGTEITLNDDVVNAEVSTYADTTSNTATATSEDTIVTANFRLDTTKDMKSKMVDVDGDGVLDEVYVSPVVDGPGGESGRLLEFKIKSTYQFGSMIMDSDESTFEVDIDWLDIFSDDNTNNDTGLSSGGRLYTWGPDGASGACVLDGDHGANASVACTQVDLPLDQTGPLAAPDSIDDPNIEIDLDNIDVRDPDGDNNLVELTINIWFDRDEEIRTHQGCVGTSCELGVINEVGVFDGTNVVGFDPVSTEDANGTNLENFNGAGEPVDNERIYFIGDALSGTWGVIKSFAGYSSASVPPKADEQYYGLGQEIPFFLTIQDKANDDGFQIQTCEKIDTSVYEYLGISAPTVNIGAFSILSPTYNTTGISAKISLNATSARWVDGHPFVTHLYSDHAHPSLADHRDHVCEDDVNGDGSVVIMDIAGNLIDQNGAATTGTVDWYQDSSMVPPLADGSSGVSKFRVEYTRDNLYVQSLGPEPFNWIELGLVYKFKIKDTAVGYGSNNYLPNFMAARAKEQAGPSWTTNWRGDEGTMSIDPENIGFSYQGNYADRNILVPSNHQILKHTVPNGLKVVRGGDDVIFELKPEVLGVWNDAVQNTASVNDNLPPGTDYVAGSEEFSTDGGATWLSFEDYQASSPAVTITNLSGSGHAGGADPLVWDFADIQNGEQLPRIRYTVHVDDVLTSGAYTNTVTLDSDMGYDADGDGTPDTATTRYRLDIYPEFGFDVLKTVADRVHEVDSAFEFDLVYKNLGGEDYSAGEFIDILPFNGDDGVLSSGVASSRDPGTDFSGSFELTNIAGSNSEVFYATDHDPTLLSTDPCISDNLPAGYVPVAGELCFENYVSNSNTLPDGASQGAGTVVWDLCTATTAPVTCGGLDPSDITAIRFTTGPVPAVGGGQTVTIELTPSGNTGGVPAFDTNGDVTAASTGNIYTNTFGGRIPEISLNVISNDVSVTVVAGSIGDYVWWDANSDGVQDTSESPIEGVDLHLLVDDGTGTFVPYMIDDPANPGTQIPYVVTTDADGAYLFENLPSGNFQVEVDQTTLPYGATQTYDNSGGLDHTSNVTLFGPDNPDTANGFTRDSYTSVDDDDEQDFGYDFPPVDLALEKTTSTSSVVPGQTVTFTVEVFNQGEVDAANITIVDYLPAGLTLGDATGWFIDLALTTPASIGDSGDLYMQIPGPLAAGDSTTVTMTVVVDDAFTGDVTNTAEIAYVEDSGGVDITDDDIDSTADDTNDDTNIDGEINDDGTLDEDDSDPETLTIGYPEPSIDVEKSTNGDDADDTDGPTIDEGGTVTWTYTVTNTGGTALTNVAIIDDPAETIICPSGDNTISLLLPDESVECEATGTADSEGVYENTASVTGDPVWPDLETCGCDPASPSTWPTDPENYNPTGQDPVADSDPSHYNTPQRTAASSGTGSGDDSGVNAAGVGKGGTPPALAFTGNNVKILAAFGLLAMLAGTLLVRSKKRQLV